jgi:hypothetical protein
MFGCILEEPPIGGRVEGDHFAMVEIRFDEFECVGWQDPARCNPC